MNYTAKILRILGFITIILGTMGSCCIAYNIQESVGKYYGSPPEWMPWIVTIGGIFFSTVLGLLLIVLADISLSHDTINGHLESILQALENTTNGKS